MSAPDPTLGRDSDLDVSAHAARAAQDAGGLHHHHQHHHSRRAGADVDVAIRQLLDQQADIQAQLRALISSARHRLDPTLELGMLRHKVRILESLVDRHGLAPGIPVLSELEEARLLQYRSECLEAACLQSNLDVAESLRLSSDEAPSGFAPWLDRHLDFHDPVIRGARAQEDRGHALVPGPHRYSSFKCWDERCVHYFYGFADQVDRDNHARLHSTLSKRDSGLSVGTEGPTPLLSEAPQPPRHMPSVHPPRPAVPSSLPPLSLPPQPPRERRDSSVSYTFPSARAGAGRASIDSDVDPLLPPLKRSRVGQPRLESIGELKLFRDDNPCLRCRATNHECDASQPCTNCLEQTPAGQDEFWGWLGCYRGSIPSLADIFLPGPLSPRQTRTPITPLAQRRTVNEYLQRAYSSLGAVAAAVRASLDFQDGFWWSGQLDQKHVSPDTLSDYGPDVGSQAPPILCAIASSWNAQDTSCNLLDLLGFSGCLSPSREAEEVTYPVLYHAKVLLREVAFYSILQPEPALRLDTPQTYRPPPEDLDLDENTRLLHECMSRYLQSLESTMNRSSGPRPSEWLAVFYSLCIFSVVRTLFLDVADASPLSHLLGRHHAGSATSDPRRAMHGAYRALVRLFVSSGPLLLDGGAGELSPEEAACFSNTSRVVRRETWAARKVASTSDFLTSLGDGQTDWYGFNGFLRQRPADQTSDDVPVLPPILKPGHAPRRSVPTIQPPADLLGQGTEAEDEEGRSQGADVGTPSLAEQGRARRHTLSETPSFLRSPGRPFGSPLPPSRFRPAYQRPPLRRVFCSKCNEHPEGFRGEHELRRHTDAKHAAMVKRWVCSEPDGPQPPSPQPVVALSKCKACLTQKHYGAYYNAAAHLRRAHFNPHRGGKASGDWPPMTILKDWMREVRQPIDMPDNDSSSGDDEELKHAAEYYAAQGTGRSSGAETPMLPLGPSSAGPLFASPTEMVGGPSAWGSGSGGAGAGTGSGTGASTGPASPTSRAAATTAENRSRCPHPDCGRVFKDLAAHMLTHQEERPEKCPIETCEYHTKGFARKYDKNRHALTHYKGTMICPFCRAPGAAHEKAFNRADVFKRHLTSVHNVEQTPPNSRKPPPAPTNVSASSSAGGPLGDAGALCSICQNRFSAAQEFYEHLDDCVLNTIAPSGARPPSLYSRELDQMRQDSLRRQQQQQQYQAQRHQEPPQHQPPHHREQQTYREHQPYQPYQPLQQSLPPPTPPPPPQQHEGAAREPAALPRMRSDEPGAASASGSAAEAHHQRDDRMVVD